MHSAIDTWWPLSMGCSVVIPAEGQLQDADAMRALIQTHSIGFLMIVPSHLQASVCQLCDASQALEVVNRISQINCRPDLSRRLAPIGGTPLATYMHCMIFFCILHVCHDAVPAVTTQVLLATCKDPAQLSSLRCLAVGGEVLNPETLALAQRMLPHATILNCYGPTEASCMVTAYDCTSAPAAQLLSVPIGKAHPGHGRVRSGPGQPAAGGGQPARRAVRVGHLPRPRLRGASRPDAGALPAQPPLPARRRVCRTLLPHRRPGVAAAGWEHEVSMRRCCCMHTGYGSWRCAFEGNVCE